MLELPYYNSFFQSTTPPAIELARILKEVTPPQFNHVFYTGSGSEANDTLIRLVRRYWQLLGNPERNVIISRWNGYHGSTVAGASLGGMKPMHEQLGPDGGVARDRAHQSALLVRRGRRPLASGVRPEMRTRTRDRRSKRSGLTGSPRSSASRCRAPVAW